MDNQLGENIKLPNHMVGDKKFLIYRRTINEHLMRLSKDKTRHSVLYKEEELPPFGIDWYE